MGKAKIAATAKENLEAKFHKPKPNSAFPFREAMCLANVAGKSVKSAPKVAPLARHTRENKKTSPLSRNITDEKIITALNIANNKTFFIECLLLKNVQSGDDIAAAMKNIMRNKPDISGA